MKVRLRCEQVGFTEWGFTEGNRYWTSRNLVGNSPAHPPEILAALKLSHITRHRSQSIRCQQAVHLYINLFIQEIHFSNQPLHLLRQRTNTVWKSVLFLLRPALITCQAQTCWVGVHWSYRTWSHPGLHQQPPQCLIYQPTVSKPPLSRLSSFAPPLIFFSISLVLLLSHSTPPIASEWAAQHGGSLAFHLWLLVRSSLQSIGRAAGKKMQAYKWPHLFGRKSYNWVTENREGASG